MERECCEYLGRFYVDDVSVFDAFCRGDFVTDVIVLKNWDTMQENIFKVLYERAKQFIGKQSQLWSEIFHAREVR